MSSIDKFTETEIKLVVVGGWGKGKLGGNRFLLE